MPESNPRWEKIVALGNAALSLAVEAHCYGRVWLPLPGHASVWTCNGMTVHDTPPWHVESWHSCMALAWANGMQVHAPTGVQSGTVDVVAPDGIWELTCVSEAQARRAICQLAVYAASQEKEGTLSKEKT